MWFKGTKSTTEKVRVAHNSSSLRLLSLPTYNSANEMYVALNIEYRKQCIIYIYTYMDYY